MTRKLSALAALGLALFSSGAMAQVNVVPQVGLNTANLRQNTYGAVSVGLVPAAAATDFFCISGSATKTVIIHNILLSGTAGTAITTPFVMLRRIALDTGGTAAVGIALPVAAKFDSTTAAATAVLTAYTANPTINDASPSLLSAPAVYIPVTTTGVGPTPNAFGTDSDMYDQGLVLRGAAQQLCLNLNGVTITSGVLATSIEWTEGQ